MGLRRGSGRARCQGAVQHGPPFSTAAYRLIRFQKALDKHHLFPDNYLKAKGYLSQRSNRGNFTLVDYQNNIYISDDAPNEYVRRYRAALGEDEYRRNCEEHALPVGFEDLDYEEFLGKRRQLMGELVKGAYERL